jgi:hypothetical protein
MHPLLLIVNRNGGGASISYSVEIERGCDVLVKGEIRPRRISSAILCYTQSTATQRKYRRFRHLVDSPSTHFTAETRYYTQFLSPFLSPWY